MTPPSENAPNVLITSAQVPFTRGGAEILVDGLKRALLDRGFNTDVVQLPFSAETHADIVKNVALWRALDLRSFNGKKVDLVISTKFPSYMCSHPNKVLWLVHQHRQMYELYGSRFGDFTSEQESEAARRILVRADREALSECRARFSISPNVSERLERYLGLQADVLLPPLPLGSRYRRGETGDYILSVGRLCSIKRVDLLIKSLPLIDDRLKVKVVGVADEPKINEYYWSEISKHHLWHRVQFLGRVSDDDLIRLYADAFAVYYAPYDEDYGFVTLEALASGKPVVTASDSGGVLGFIQHEVNGLVAESNENAVAAAFNRLFSEQSLYQRLCASDTLSHPNLDWDGVIAQLTATLQHAGTSPSPTDAEVRQAAS
ncbi:MAG: glycosyltransferase family 4 protein [Deltaproteobacteria bacterium]|nr:glycosyltransferase family 4 protein [Deltaproteobacteria bacterium]